jgi:hypothetical protein
MSPEELVMIALVTIAIVVWLACAFAADAREGQPVRIRVRRVSSSEHPRHTR